MAKSSGNPAPHAIPRISLDEAFEKKKDDSGWHFPDIQTAHSPGGSTPPQKRFSAQVTTLRIEDDADQESEFHFDHRTKLDRGSPWSSSSSASSLQSPVKPFVSTPPSTRSSDSRVARPIFDWMNEGAAAVGYDGPGLVTPSLHLIPTPPPERSKHGKPPRPVPAGAAGSPPHKSTSRPPPGNRSPCILSARCTWDSSRTLGEHLKSSHRVQTTDNRRNFSINIGRSFDSSWVQLAVLAQEVSIGNCLWFLERVPSDDNETRFLVAVYSLDQRADLEVTMTLRGGKKKASWMGPVRTIPLDQVLAHADRVKAGDGVIFSITLSEDYVMKVDTSIKPRRR